jgi:phosphoglycerate kinase
MESFANGTIELGKYIAASTAKELSVGGDSVAAVKQFGLEDKMSCFYRWRSYA